MERNELLKLTCRCNFALWDKADRIVVKDDLYIAQYKYLEALKMSTASEGDPLLVVEGKFYQRKVEIN